MSSPREVFGKETPAHSLSFKVMRLCKPIFSAESPLKLDLNDVWHGEDEHKFVPNIKNTTDIFSSRCDLSVASDMSGLSGLMVLPQSFGYQVL